MGTDYQRVTNRIENFLMKTQTTDKSFLILNRLKTNDLTQWLRASLMKWAKIHETFPLNLFFVHTQRNSPHPNLN